MNIFKQLGEKSWATPGLTGEINDRSRGAGPAAKTMLRFFLAVLSSMFLLFAVGYRMRMAMPDWVAIADPELLWLNTALLIVSSIFMQRARSAANEARILGDVQSPTSRNVPMTVSIGPLILANRAFLKASELNSTRNMARML